MPTILVANMLSASRWLCQAHCEMPGERTKSTSKFALIRWPQRRLCTLFVAVIKISCEWYRPEGRNCGMHGRRFWFDFEWLPDYHPGKWNSWHGSALSTLVSHRLDNIRECTTWIFFLPRNIRMIRTEWIKESQCFWHINLSPAMWFESTLRTLSFLLGMRSATTNEFLIIRPWPIAVTTTTTLW